MESCRLEDFPEASAVDEGEFRNFFNHGVTEVNTLKQSTTVTSVRSYGYKVLWESKCVDAAELRPLGGMETHSKVTSARLMHPWKRYCPKLASPLNTFTAPSDAYTRCKEQHSEKAL